MRPRLPHDQTLTFLESLSGEGRGDPRLGGNRGEAPGLDAASTQPAALGHRRPPSAAMASSLGGSDGSPGITSHTQTVARGPCNPSVRLGALRSGVALPVTPPTSATVLRVGRTALFYGNVARAASTLSHGSRCLWHGLPSPSGNAHTAPFWTRGSHRVTPLRVASGEPGQAQLQEPVLCPPRPRLSRLVALVCLVLILHFGWCLSPLGSARARGRGVGF